MKEGDRGERNGIYLKILKYEDNIQERDEH